MIKMIKAVIRSYPVLAAALLAVMPLVAGCGENGPAEPGSRVTLQVHANEGLMETASGSPDPSSVFASAEVVVSRIYLVGEGNEAEPEVRVDLAPETLPRTLDLIDLENGKVEELAEAQVPAGVFHQLRIVIDEATVELAEGYTFEDGSTIRSLKVPSGSTSGIKVELIGPVESGASELIEMLVEMDVSRNFVIQGSQDTPAGIKSVLFTPSLKEYGRNRTSDS